MAVMEVREWLSRVVLAVVNLLARREINTRGLDTPRDAYSLPSFAFVYTYRYSKLVSLSQPRPLPNLALHSEC